MGTPIRNKDLSQYKGAEVLPSKIVWGLKPQDSTAPAAPIRKKARIVCCGNHETEKQQEVYTSLMDASGLRMLTKIAANSKWSMGKLDISTAFLNAPLSEQTIIVRPPAFLLALGLIEEDELWLLSRALYGLRVAPKAWEIERDLRLRAAAWEN